MRRPLAKTAARGYGWAHQRERARQALIVAAGQAYCWRCGGWIQPGSEWHLGHDDNRVTRGPEHARSCNLAAAARKTNHRRGAKRHPFRIW